MTGWRMFVGAHDGEWAHVDHVFTDYEEARTALAAEIRPLLEGECSYCHTAGTAALARLSGLAVGTDFVDELDGEAYVLISAGRDLGEVL